MISRPGTRPSARREMTLRPHDRAEAGVQRLDRVRRAEDLADLDVVIQERDELGPGVAPKPDQRRIGPVCHRPRSVIVSMEVAA